MSNAILPLILLPLRARVECGAVFVIPHFSALAEADAVHTNGPLAFH